MTVHDLVALLEGCALDAGLRIALSTRPATELQVLGLAQSQALGDTGPPIVWILAGETIGTAPEDLFCPARRHRP